MRGYTIHSDKPEFIFATPKLLQRFWPPSPESNRQMLREALIESFGDYGEIDWECKIIGISKKSNGKAELFGLNNKSLGEFDLVIDSSGFSSCLRKERIKEDPENLFERYYTGISMIHGLIRDPESSCCPKIVKKLGQGTMLTFTKGQCFGLQRYGAKEDDRRTSLYFMLPVSDMNQLSEQFNLPKKTKFIDDIDKLEAVRKWIIETLEAPEDYQSAINAMDSFAIRPLIQHPIDVEFLDNDLPLILIGDALHAVPPYTGSGGNIALDDANDLAKYLEDKRGHFELKELRDLEQKFLARTSSVSKDGYETRDNLIASAKIYKETGKDVGSPLSASWFMYLFCLIFTTIFNLELFFGLRKDDGRN